MGKSATFSRKIDFEEILYGLEPCGRTLSYWKKISSESVDDTVFENFVTKLELFYYLGNMDENRIF